MRKRMKDTELKAFVSKLNQKRESILLSLLNLETKRRDAQKQLERRMRLRAKEEERKLEPDTLAQDPPVWPALERERAKEAAGSPGKSEPAPEIDVAARKVPTLSGNIAVKDDGIPDYLRRDQIAREKIESELAAAKKAKADKAAKRRKIKAEMVKADLSGQTRRMPLEGRAALAAIAKR